MNKNIKVISRCSIGIAIVFVVTKFVGAVPIGGGYFNLSDLIIMIIAFHFGPLVGMISGIGAALADLFGFATFIPFTLVTKLFTGWLIGYGSIWKLEPKSVTITSIVSMFLMIAVYWMHDLIILKTALNLVNLYTNMIQGLVSIIGFIIYRKIRRR